MRAVLASNGGAACSFALKFDEGHRQDSDEEGGRVGRQLQGLGGCHAGAAATAPTARPAPPSPTPAGRRVRPPTPTPMPVAPTTTAWPPTPSPALTASATKPPGVTSAGDCDLYAQAPGAPSCTPSAYDQACVPFDGNTNGCWPSGPRVAGQTCSWSDAALSCDVGLYCSLLDCRCYVLCDPAAADTCPGAQQCFEQESAPGIGWFGVCG